MKKKDLISGFEGVTLLIAVLGVINPEFWLAFLIFIPVFLGLAMPPKAIPESEYMAGT